MGATFFGVPSESGDYKKYGYENFQMDQNPTKSHNDFSGLRQLSQKLDMRFNRKKQQDDIAITFSFSHLLCSSNCRQLKNWVLIPASLSFHDAWELALLFGSTAASL
jgi:hypothetical protein